MSGYTTNGLTVYGLALTTGAEQAAFDTELGSGGFPESVAISGNALRLGWQLVAAAGATQGTATKIGVTAYNVIVSATTSSEGIKLPTAATGLQFKVVTPTANGVKVYANAAGQSIGTGTTNTTATTVAANSVQGFLAVSATKWRLA